MAWIDRIGQRVGTLTVLADAKGAVLLRCRCDCGREGTYPRAIFKTGYKGPTKCRICRSHPCAICGTPIEKPNKETCSPVCHKERNRIKGREYYQSVKDTDRFHVVRQEYLAKLKARLEADPAFREQYQAKRRLAVATHVRRLMQDPIKRQQFLIARRLKERARVANPVALAAKREAARRWYYSLSDAPSERTRLARCSYYARKKNNTMKNESKEILPQRDNFPLSRQYNPPQAKIGDLLLDRKNEAVERVDGFTEALIPWPFYIYRGKRCLIIQGDIIEAMKNENENHIAYHWGVCVNSVNAWKKKLGIRSDAPLAMPSPWSDRDKEQLRRLYGTVSVAKLSSIMGRTSSAIKSTAKQMGLTKTIAQKTWLPEEDFILETKYKDVSVEDLAKELGRTVRSVTARAGVLGLKKLKQWTPEEDKILMENYLLLGPDLLQEKFFPEIPSSRIKWHAWKIGAASPKKEKGF